MPETPTRDFTVAVFIVNDGRVLLHPHLKLGIWLPPGGHIEPHELPDEAAHREVLEEAGITISLVQDPDLPEDRPGEPRQLTRPAGIQLETIAPDHEHIDLIYFATPNDPSAPVLAGMQWFTLAEIEAHPDITGEVRDWAVRAISALTPVA
jgi:8-oxo-dGTP pyrophosphatase MutT (NUDIX family)